jgi:hypothetical protein
MTREEAEKQVIENNKKGIESFCPLINHMCRIDCISFIPSKLHRYNDDYSVYAPYCSCNLFNEKLEVYATISY